MIWIAQSELVETRRTEKMHRVENIAKNTSEETTP